MLFGTFRNPARFDGRCGFGPRGETAIGGLLLGRDVSAARTRAARRHGVRTILPMARRPASRSWATRMSSSGRTASIWGRTAPDSTQAATRSPASRATLGLPPAAPAGESRAPPRELMDHLDRVQPRRLAAGCADQHQPPEGPQQPTGCAGTTSPPTPSSTMSAPRSPVTRRDGGVEVVVAADHVGAQRRGAGALVLGAMPSRRRSGRAACATCTAVRAERARRGVNDRRLAGGRASQARERPARGQQRHQQRRAFLERAATPEARSRSRPGRPRARRADPVRRSRRRARPAAAR